MAKKNKIAKKYKKGDSVLKLDDLTQIRNVEKSYIEDGEEFVVTVRYKPSGWYGEMLKEVEKANSLTFYSPALERLALRIQKNEQQASRHIKELSDILSRINKRRWRR